MNKIAALDYNNLEKSLSKKLSYKLSDVQGRIEKVAFDVVRFVDSQNIDDLWQIQSCDDGEYIVAMYDDDEALKAEASVNPSSLWKVASSNATGQVSIFYKDHPLAHFNSSDFGIPKNEASLMNRYLPSKLASSPSFVRKTLGSLSDLQQSEIYSKFPELLQPAASF